MAKDYVSENERRKKAVQKEERFVEKELLNNEPAGEEVFPENRKTQIEKKKTDQQSV